MKSCKYCGKDIVLDIVHEINCEKNPLSLLNYKPYTPPPDLKIPTINFDLINDMKKRQEEKKKKEAQMRRDVSIAVLHIHEREAEFGLTPFTRRFNAEQARILRAVLSHP